MEKTIRVGGMTCEGCAGRVKRVLELEPGVREANVSHETGEARVRFNEHTVEASRMRERIEQAGYTMEAGA